MAQEASGIFSRDSINEQELYQRTHDANVLASEHYPFIDEELHRRIAAEVDLDKAESLQKGELVQSTKVEYQNGVVLKTSRNLPRPGEDRHLNQDLVRVIEIAPGVQMTLLIDGASELAPGVESRSEEMVARYAEFLSSDKLFPNLKGDLPGILKLLTGYPSETLEGAQYLENLMKNVHEAFMAWAKENKGKPGFKNYEDWGGFGYMSMIFPIRRSNRHGKLTNCIVVIEMGSKDYKRTKAEVEAGHKKIKKGDSGHVVIINGRNAQSSLTISSYFNQDLTMSNISGDVNAIEFPVGLENLKGYNVWYGSKPNSPSSYSHIVRPNEGLKAFRLSVVEGLEDDAVTINVSDAARMNTLDPQDPKLFTVNPFDDLSQTITTNMI